MKALREAAEEADILTPNVAAVDREVAKREAKRKRDAYDEDLRDKREKEVDLQKLRERFAELVRGSANPQARGFSLEPLLGELIVLENLCYAKPFRKGTVTQTDGFFTFDGFRYLIEARWRKSAPDVAALNAFGGKVQSTLQSTRGLFLSVTGFRDDAVDEFSRTHRNLILMSGVELTLILEGRFTFKDAMRRKIDEASRTGRLFFEVS